MFKTIQTVLLTQILVNAITNFKEILQHGLEKKLCIHIYTYYVLF